MSPGNDPVERTEYEQYVRMSESKHAELHLEIKEVETDLKTQMNSMMNKIDLLSVQMTKRSLDAWKLIATSMVSLVGGYILGHLHFL